MTERRPSTSSHPRTEECTHGETPYMLHCHVLQHEDRGMTAQFVVPDDR
jgi:FtsP/CotA-like multicopper oxidase with cupredoxin domain